MPLRVLTWNLFHGRDFPPNRELFTPRSRLLRLTERDASHVQVNRDLCAEFSRVLSAADWDVALLQESPPRWSRHLAAACDAGAHRVLTSRNWFLPITSALATWNPDLIASWEGGSNLTLVRGGEIAARRTHVMRPLLPERRAMAFTRLATGTCIANLHASTRRELAEAEVRAAARIAVEWAGDAPLVLGGDLNLRPDRSGIFDELAERHGLRAPTAGDSIDHLLARGLALVSRPTAWPPERRELPVEDDLRLRLSDHAPVEAQFAAPPAVSAPQPGAG